MTNKLIPCKSCIRNHLSSFCSVKTSSNYYFDEFFSTNMLVMSKIFLCVLRKCGVNVLTESQPCAKRRCKRHSYWIKFFKLNCDWSLFGILSTRYLAGTCLLGIGPCAQGTSQIFLFTNGDQETESLEKKNREILNSKMLVLIAFFGVSLTGKFFRLHKHFLFLY